MSYWGTGISILWVREELRHNCRNREKKVRGGKRTAAPSPYVWAGGELEHRPQTVILGIKKNKCGLANLSKELHVM